MTRTPLFRLERNIFQVSISPTFYARLFHMKVSLKAFFTLLEWTFFAQEYWRKFTHKMLVKLTTSHFLSFISRNFFFSWQFPRCIIAQTIQLTHHCCIHHLKCRMAEWIQSQTPIRTYSLIVELFSGWHDLGFSFWAQYYKSFRRRQAKSS